jgi:hypothetical protein
LVAELLNFSGRVPREHATLIGADKNLPIYYSVFAGHSRLVT